MEELGGIRRLQEVNGLSSHVFGERIARFAARVQVTERRCHGLLPDGNGW